MSQNKANFLTSVLLLIVVVSITFFWASTSLRQYSLQFITLLLLLFISKHIIFKSFLPDNLFEALIFTALVLILVIDTGGLTSPLFFLVYFLLFGISLMLEPLMALILSFLMIVCFLILHADQTDPIWFITLTSLPLITPLAVFMGNTYYRQKKEEAKLAKEEEQTMLWLDTAFLQHLDEIRKIIDNFQNKKQLEMIKDNLNRLEKLGQKLKKLIYEEKNL